MQGLLGRLPVITMTQAFVFPSRWRERRDSQWDPDFDPHGPGVGVDRRGDLAHSPFRGDLGVGDQRDLRLGDVGDLGENRLVDVKNRIARAILCDRKDRPGLLDNVADLGKARRDHPRFAGLKDRVVELVLSRLALIVGGIERGLRGAQRLLGLVKGRTRL